MLSATTNNEKLAKDRCHLAKSYVEDVEWLLKGEGLLCVYCYLL